MENYFQKLRDTLNTKISTPFLLSIVFFILGVFVIINTNLDGFGALVMGPVMVVSVGLFWGLSLVFLLSGLVCLLFKKDSAKSHKKKLK